MKELLAALSLIFVAEMGDKTQLLALAFATQYSIVQVLSGVFLGAFFNHGIAIVSANIISKFASMNYLQIVSCIAFLVFGLFSLKPEKDDRDEKQNKILSRHMHVILAIASSFFLGELGDKTQLTAMTLGLQSSKPFMTLLGSSLGMVAVSCFGIVAGRLLNTKIPETTLRTVSGMVFLFFGISSLWNLKQNKILSFPSFGSILFMVCVFAVIFLYQTFQRTTFSKETISTVTDFHMKSVTFTESHSNIPNDTTCLLSECFSKHIKYTDRVITPLDFTNNRFSRRNRSNLEHSQSIL